MNVEVLYSSFLKNTPLAIIVCADDSVDTWVEDTTIAAIMIQLTAESLGLKSCWVQIRERYHDKITSAREYIAPIIDLPGNINIESIIAVGYPKEEKAPHKQEKLRFDKIYVNAYGQPLQ